MLPVPQRQPRLRETPLWQARRLETGVVQVEAVQARRETMARWRRLVQVERAQLGLVLLSVLSGYLGCLPRGVRRWVRWVLWRVPVWC